MQLYVWRYSHAPNGLDPSQSESPVLLLKTKRSLRAVQFHPTGAPLMLTAEVGCLLNRTDLLSWKWDTCQACHPTIALFFVMQF